MNTKALKAKILDLAIHGKLVPQNPEHESAEKLLEKIRAEKEEKIAKGELKRDKKDSYIFVGDDKRHYEKFADGTVKDIEDEIPFEVPDGWAWCRLNELAEIARGGSPRPIQEFLTDDDNGLNWIKIGDTKIGSKYITTVKEKIKPEGLKKTRLVHAGDFLLTNSMSFGRPYILKVDGCIHDGWLVFADIINCVDKDFLYYALSSKYIYDVFSLKSAGSTVKNLKSDTVKEVLFALPPHEEQKIIVSKIEEIFSHIDKLDSSKLDLQTAIKHAKSKILDLAIHGRLVPQDPSEEPASKLLEKIHAEKEAKIAAGELKRDKNDSYIYKNPSDNCHYRKYIDGHEEYVEDEFYRNIPVNWCLCNLGELCLEIKRGKSPKYTDKSNYLVFAQKCNQKYGPTSLEKALYLDESTLKKYPSSEFMQFDDIVINSTGTGTMGRVGIFKNALPYDIKGIVPDSHVTVIRTMRNIDQNYIYAFLKLNQGKLEGFGEGSTNQKELKPLTISELIIPLPPAEEQKRIVSKIEEIFGILDTISKNLE